MNNPWCKLFAESCQCWANYFHMLSVAYGLDVPFCEHRVEFDEMDQVCDLMEGRKDHGKA